MGIDPAENRSERRRILEETSPLPWIECAHRTRGKDVQSILEFSAGK